MPTKDKAKVKNSGMQRLALLAIVTALAVVVGGFFIYKLAGSLMHEGRLLKAKRNANSQLEVKVANAPKIVDEYKKLGYKRDTINSALPNDADFPQIVTIASSMATAAQVSLMSVSPDLTSVDAAPAAPAAATTGAAATTPAAGTTATAAAGAPAPMPTNFTVAIAGGYTGITAFLKNVELSSRPMRVTAITINGSGGDITADISITTYFQGAASIDDTEEVIK